MISETTYSVDPQILDTARQLLKSFEGKTVLNYPTGSFFYDPWIISDEYKNTVWDKILSTLDFNIGEARIIVLKPGESYMAHADIDDRFHLNLEGHYSFLTDIRNKKMYPTMSDNKWYKMDAGKIHAAVNYGEIPRFQLVVRQLLTHGNFNRKVHVYISPVIVCDDYRYKFDNSISPWLNQMNKIGRLDNFKFENLKVEFDTDEEMIFDLVKFDKKYFEITYEF